jgi:hypothetical protein
MARTATHAKPTDPTLPRSAISASVYTTAIQLEARHERDKPCSKSEAGQRTRRPSATVEADSLKISDNGSLAWQAGVVPCSVRRHAEFDRHPRRVKGQEADRGDRAGTGRVRAGKSSPCGEAL